MLLKRRDINLTEGPIFKNVLLFAIPIILSGVLQLLFNAADVIVVGRFAGEAELAAVGSNGPIINLIVNIGIGLSVGANVLTARYIGERDRERVHRTVHTAVVLSIISGLLAGFILFTFSGALLRILKTPADVFSGAAGYLKAYAVGMPASIIYNFGAAILRAKGDTARPLYFLIIAGFVNVFLNLIFVIGAHMGALGVGIATAASQYVACALVVLCLMHEEGPVKLRLSKLRLYKDETLSIVGIGLPAGIQGSLFAISNMIVQSSINSFDNTALMAGNAAAGNIEGFVYITMNAFYHTMLTLAGQNVGARKFDRVDRGLGVCAGTVSGIGLLLGVLVVLFDSALLSIYSKDAEVIYYGSIRFLYLALPYFVCGIMETVLGAVRGLGYSIAPMIMAILGACGFRILWIYTVFAKYKTLGVLLICYVISWVLTAAAHFITYLVARKKVRRKYKDA